MCISFKLALAEFELEYNSEHKSQAFYVAYEMTEYSDEIRKFISELKKIKKNFSFLISFE